MDVDVDLVRRQRQKQREHGIAPLRQEIAVSRADRAGEQLVAHGTPVDDEMKLEAVRPVQRRQAGKALEQGGPARGAQGKRILDEVRPENSAHAGEAMIEKPRRARLKAKDRALVAREREGDVGPRESEPLHHLGDGGALDALRFHEFQPRRRRIEQIAHLDARANRESGRLELRFSPRIDRQLVGVTGARRPACKREPRDRADRGQRLAAEAERHDRGEIVARELRGGVALDSEREIARVHAGAVVGDANETQAAAGSRDLDAARAGIERILDQFLDDARGTLDDLTGGDAVDEVWRQLADGHLSPRRGHRRDTGGSVSYPILPPAGRTGRRPKDEPREWFPA